MRISVLAVLCAVTTIAVAAFPMLAKAEATPKWTVACETAAKDKFGEKTRQYCSLLVFNSRKTGEGSPFVMDDGSTFIMDSRTVVEIDVRGVRLKRPPRGDYCKPTTLRIAVDGKRIDGLTSAQQIRAMTEGQMFVWEEQADWPNCQNKAPHGTTLEGFREGLDELTRRFNAIRS